ncbi:FG-GAP-like repeat-containing protein [Streptomyces sp. NPDC005775]|uniref:FG-GAP-like repeat-containing protein n=1 Tax=Streptomyces sp. NPDC005775 TaxID=3364729 RepID=UPI00368F284F
MAEHSAGTITLHDMAAGTATRLNLPETDSFVGLVGESVLVRDYATDELESTAGWYVLPANGDQAQRVPISGWPEEANMHGARLVAGDSHTAVLRFGTTENSWESTRLGLVDLATGHMRVWEADLGSSGVTLSPKALAWVDSQGLVHVRDRAATDGIEQPFVLPSGLSRSRIGLLDGWILASEEVSGVGSDLERGLVALSADGKRTIPLLGGSAEDLVQMPGGSVAVVGGTSSTDWYLKQVSVGFDGQPTMKNLHRASPLPGEVQAVALSGGVLSTVEVEGSEGAGFYNRSLGVGPDTTPAGPATWIGRESGRSYDYTSCGQISCTQLLNSGDGRSVYQVRNYESNPQVEVVGRRSSGEASRALTGNFDGRVVDSFGRYAVYQGGRPSIEGMLVPEDKTIVVDLDATTGSSVVIEQPQVAASVWGDTLYSGTATRGQVAKTDLPSRKKTGTVDTGAPCDLTELQTAGDWLYWSCDQYARHGVVNLRTGAKAALPGVGGSGLLGDGFFVQHPYSGAELRLTTFQNGSVATRYLDERVGSSRTNRRGSYAVDRFGGGIAYVDMERMIHVADSGVTASPLSLVTSHADAGFTAAKGWQPSWWLSKPAASWQVSIASRATGAVVRTITGGEARGTFTAGWNGTDAAGKLVANGAYTWSLSAKPADGQGPALAVSGSVKVTGGAAADRDFVGNDGFGDLLGFTPAGVADFRGGTGNGTGTVDAKVSGSGWTGANSVTASVPFDDVNGDRCNDVLVRVKSGELRAYKPSCGGALKSTTPYTKVGLGWNIYDALTSPGDLTGDGRADVVARETSTGYLFLYESTAAGVFKARVKIGTGWKGYLLAGAGDLNRDGKGDLLARDEAGALWRYAGTGEGTLAARVKVGGGWQVYNSLVGVGDSSGDGKADLLARDTSGVLWAYRGDGKGSFGYRTRVGGGWQMYSGLS